MEFKKRIKLLALAHTPKTGNSIRDWRPFEEDTLDTIIRNYNKRCLERYQEKECLQEYIGNCMEVIRIVDVDLSTVRSKLESKHFDDIHIILIDIDAIGEIEERKTVLDFIKVCLSNRHRTFLPQVSRTPSAMSYDVTYFKPKLVKIPMPDIMGDQATFEGWLNEEICERFQICYTVFTAPPPDEIRNNPADLLVYQKNLPWVADKVRDAAIIKDLSEEETVALAHQASMQEVALTRIVEQVHTRTNRDVVLDAIREPVVDMPIELGFQSPALRQVNLVELHVTQPMYMMTIEQRNIMRGFGIKEEVEPFAVVVPDQPTVRDSVEKLKGVAKTTKFSAELPVGLGGIRGNL